MQSVFLRGKIGRGYEYQDLSYERRRKCEEEDGSCSAIYCRARMSSGGEHREDHD